MLIFTVEREFDYCGSEVTCASDSLQQCIDAINNHRFFPYLCDYVSFSIFDNGVLIASVPLNGKRGDDGDNKGKFTFEEVMGALLKEQEKHKS